MNPVPPKAEGVETQKAAALTSIICERQRQDEKWGEQNHDPFTYLAVLVEEVGEFAQAALHHRFGGREAFGMRQEAVQVAAVALAIIECIDRAKWAWPLHAGETAPRADSLSPEKAPSVGRGTAANPPPGNPKESCVAAAAEDAAEWTWFKDKIRGGAGIKMRPTDVPIWFPKATDAQVICHEVNSCVSRLQEQLRVLRKDHEDATDNAEYNEKCLLARAEEAEAKLKIISEKS